jgi:hypothetical protein
MLQMNGLREFRDDALRLVIYGPGFRDFVRLLFGGSWLSEERMGDQGK